MHCNGASLFIRKRKRDMLKNMSLFGVVTQQPIIYLNACIMTVYLFLFFFFDDIYRTFLDFHKNLADVFSNDSKTEKLNSANEKENTYHRCPSEC